MSSALTIRNELTLRAFERAMRSIAMRLMTVAFALTVFEGNAIAQRISDHHAADFSLRSYVAQRWLYGNSEKMLKELQYLNYQIPVNGMQISVKRLLTKEKNAAVVAGFIEYASVKGKTQPLTQAEASQQFDLWRDCLVKQYEVRFTEDNLKTLQGYWNSGVFRDFPQLTIAVKEIPFVALQRVAGMRSKQPPQSEASQTYKEPYLQDTSLRIYLALANPIQETYMAMFLPNGKNHTDLGEELKITVRELLASANPLGVDAKTWSSVEAYAMSDLPGNEQSIFRSCHNGSFTRPMSTWSAGVFSVMTEYFDNSAAVFGN
ncbi:hypothetical protein MCEMSEM18_02373 [Comamonadaceae bacterium]